ncbi:MAG: FAD-binding protein [Actinomycetota bacterium]|nr:FAD-binding protein [Actinomycetota bacterium]
MTAPPLAADPVLAAFAEEVGATDAVAVEGARTRWAVGGAVADGTRLVKAPTGIVRHEAEEMIVCVRAGTPVAELAATLAQRGQRCALPDHGGTVGGAIAAGENDLLVLGCGTLRASVLEVRYVSAEGRLIRGGGPTVKNVTGFDLPRIMVGALGTLGLIAEVILRTNPLPATSLWAMATDADPFAARDALLRPAAVLWDGTHTWVNLEGHAPDVTAQLALLGTVGRFAEVQGPPPLPACRWSLAPGELRHLHAQQLGGFVASVGVGLVHAERPQPSRALPPTVAALSARVKSNFDPTGRLNPGRNPGAR